LSALAKGAAAPLTDLLDGALIRPSFYICHEFVHRFKRGDRNRRRARHDERRIVQLLACELRGERWEPARQYGVAQAFVPEVDFTDPRHENLYAWDDDQAIYVALALSRLIRPHATACDYAVRRIIDTDGRQRLVPHDAEAARVEFRIEDSRAAYDDSSGVVHGAQVDLGVPVVRTRFVSEVDALQLTLRAAIRKAIEDPQFRALFASDAAITVRWPLRP